MLSKRGVRRAAICVAAVLLVGIFLTVLDKWLIIRRAATAIGELKQAGIATELDAFDLRHESMPREANAAVSYQKAFDELAELSAGGQPRWVPYAGRAEMPESPLTPFDESTLENVRRYLVERTQVLGLLKYAGGLEESAYAVSWGQSDVNTPLPFLKGLRESAKLLVVASCFEAELGSGDEALSHVRDILRLGRSADKEPGLIAGMVSMGVCTSAVFPALERVIARSEASEQALEGIQKELEKTASGMSVEGALRGEIAFLVSYYTKVKRGEMASWEISGEKPRSMLMRFLQKRRFMCEVPKALRAMSEILDKAEAPTAGALYNDDAAGAEERDYSSTAGKVVDHSGRVFLLCEAMRAKLRAAAAGVAALRFKRREGRWPEKLEELVANNWLESVPEDPFTGKPLRYRRLDDALLFYTVSYNLQDDCGPPTLPGAKGGTAGEAPGADSDDIGFRLWYTAGNTGRAR